MGRRYLSSRFAEMVPESLLAILPVAYCLGVVALFASDRIAPLQAGLLLGAPVVLGLAVLRPEWMVLVLVVVPPSMVLLIPPMQMVAIMLATLFGFYLHGRISLGPQTGIYPLVVIIALAVVFRADTSAAARATADSNLKFLAYYTLLMLVGFHAIANRRMRIDTFVNALVLGIVIATILQPFIAGSEFEAIDQTPFRGQIAYLATMGFGVTYVRLSLRRSMDERQYGLDSIFAVVFLLLTAIGFGRATWIAALLIFALVSSWTGRKWFWVVFSVVLILVLTVPLVGERVVPGGSVNTSEATLARVTTGRSELWTELLGRGAEAMPFGHGWGYTWSLTSTELFGFEGQFGAEGNGYVFPHNDFLFLYLEFGILGLGLLIVFWLLLIRKIRLLSTSNREQVRYDVRVLVPVTVVMFLVQLFDNGFAIRFVAERFFIVAGLVFGLASLQQGDRWDVADSRSVDTSQGSARLDV
jgi:O-antigen ligase